MTPAVAGASARLEVSALRVRRGAREVLRGVDLSLAAGETVALLGANGAGKSTLLLLMAGLGAPSAGAVRVAGVTAHDPRAARTVRSTVGLLFQEPEHQFVAARVEDDVAFAPQNLGLPPHEVRRRTARALAAVGLEDRAGDAPAQLSGGERRRLAFAGLLAQAPRFLLLDEPGTGLDAAGRRSLAALLRRCAAAGQGVVFATHDPEEAATADRVVVLAEGEVVAEGPPEAVLGAAARLRAWGLDLPPAVALGEALAEAGLLPAAARWPLDLETLALALRRRWPRPGTGALPAVAGRGTGAAGTEGTAESGAGRARGAELPRDPGTLPQPAEGLVLSAVRCSYPRRTEPALHGLDLFVRPGECLCLVGANGAGKSTAALVAGGLLRPAAGHVAADGVDPRRGGPRVGVAFQAAEAQFFEASVLREVAFGPRCLGHRREAAEAAARAALAAVRLPAERWLASPFALSGGQKRRVALASLLATGPRYLVLDEPLAGLDAPGRRGVQEVVERLTAAGHGVLVLSPRAEDALELGARVAVLHRGRVVAEGPPRAVLASPSLEAWGLAPPAPLALRAALARYGLDLAPALSAQEVVAALAHAVRAPAARREGGPGGAGDGGTGR